MTFRDPLTSLAADAITSGTFTGTYRNTGTFVLAGTPGASRIEASGTELAFYAADGTTKLIDLDTASGAGVIRSTEIDGATITGGLIQTADSGARWAMGTNLPGGPPIINGYSGMAGEQTPGNLLVGPNVLRGGATQGAKTVLTAPYFGDSSLSATLSLFGKDPVTGGANQAQLSADSVQVDRGTGAREVWAGDNLLIALWSGTAGANGQVVVNFPAGAFSSAPAVYAQATSGFAYAVVSAVTAASFTLTTRGAGGTVPAVGSALSGFYIAGMP